MSKVADLLNNYKLNLGLKYLRQHFMEFIMRIPTDGLGVQNAKPQLSSGSGSTGELLKDGRVKYDLGTINNLTICSSYFPGLCSNIKRTLLSKCFKLVIWRDNFEVGQYQRAVFILINKSCF